MAGTGRLCEVFFPLKSCYASLFPNLVFQPEFTLLSPLCHPLHFPGLPAAVSGRLWSCFDVCWQGGPVVRTDAWMFYVRCPRPWVFPDPPWQIRPGMGLLPLPELSLFHWIKAAEPGLSLPQNLCLKWNFCEALPFLTTSFCISKYKICVGGI